MKVSTLLEGLKYICCQGSTEQEVSTVVYDSRKVEEIPCLSAFAVRLWMDTNLYRM